MLLFGGVGLKQNSLHLFPEQRLLVVEIKSNNYVNFEGHYLKHLCI